MAQSSYRTQLNNYLKESGIGLDIISPLIQNLALGSPLLRSEYFFLVWTPSLLARTPLPHRSEGVLAKGQGSIPTKLVGSSENFEPPTLTSVALPLGPR